MLRLLPALGLLVGCAGPVAVTPDADHPASPDAPAAPAVVTLAALAPAPAPDVPAVLRPDGAPPAGSVTDPDPTPHGVGHDATAHVHGAMNHGRTAVETPSPAPPGDAPPAPVTPVGPALDAYLAVHDALAADRPDADAAAALEATLADLVATPPASDPHLWHRMDAEVEAARAGARALAAAGDPGSSPGQALRAGRAAFGALSVPFAALVEAAGVPEGYDLGRHTCGMTDAPEGGVWLQREGPVRNPYFGAGMLMCSRGSEPVGSEPAGGAAHGEHGAHGSGH